MIRVCRSTAKALCAVVFCGIGSTTAGAGDPLPADVVRGTMLLLAASLARGHSGVSIQVVETILAMLNADLTPVVPEIGSVGASGDLAPLAHIALASLAVDNVSNPCRETSYSNENKNLYMRCLCKEYWTLL